MSPEFVVKERTNERAKQQQQQKQQSFSSTPNLSPPPESRALYQSAGKAGKFSYTLEVTSRSQSASAVKAGRSSGL